LSVSGFKKIGKGGKKVSHKKEQIGGRKEKAHPNDTLMESLGRENILSDGLLFQVDDTQRISNMLAEESVEKASDLNK